MKEKYPLLKAEEHNWGLKTLGSWVKTVWLVYSDRKYEMKSYYNPPLDRWKELMNARGSEVHRNPDDYMVCCRKTGKIPQKNFDNLLEILETNPWLDAEIDCRACDGVAWKIEQYSPDGSVRRSSGDVGYIYGQRVLETIAALLPSSEKYGASAYVTVSRKEGD